MNIERKDSTPLVTTPAVLMAPRQDGMEVVWGVSRPAKGKLEWKEKGDSRLRTMATDSFGFVPQSDWLFRIRLEGLTPGKEYTVRTVTEAVDDGERIESEWNSFRTLDSSAATIHFAVWSDTHNHVDTLSRLHGITPPVDFLLWNGDTCNNWTDPESQVPTLLYPGGQDISRQRPLLMTWGNHDVRGPWAYRTQQIIATPNGLPYYALRSGPVAFIFLHTGEDKPDDHPSFGGRTAFDALRRQQAEWMQRVIAQPGFCDAPYRVVCCHLPLRWRDESQAYEFTQDFDHYSFCSRNLWHDTLVSWNTQLIISGHTHEVVWLPATKDFPYAQLTNGGPTLANASWLEGKANSQTLTLVARNLNGQELIRAELPALTASLGKRKRIRP